MSARLNLTDRLSKAFGAVLFDPVRHPLLGQDSRNAVEIMRALRRIHGKAASIMPLLPHAFGAVSFAANLHPQLDFRLTRLRHMAANAQALECAAGMADARAVPSIDTPTEKPQPSESLDVQRRWFATMREQGRFSAFPEIEAVLTCGGPPLTPDRAKQFAADIVDGLGDQLPKVEAVRNVLHVVEELARVAATASTILANDDETVLADPAHFLTPDHELAHRASRIARQMVVERDIVSQEDFEAIAPESYRLAREAMGDRGGLPKAEPQDLAPMALLRLRQVIDGVNEVLHAIYDQAKGPLELYLQLSLFPRPLGGRPSLDLAMFLAWLLQDATTRGMTDARVGVFLEDAFAKLPGQWGKLAPSVSTVTRWRQAREKVPEIPHHGRPHKRR